MIFTAWAPVGPRMSSLGKPIHLRSPGVPHKTPPTTQNILCSMVGSYPSGWVISHSSQQYLHKLVFKSDRVNMFFTKTLFL